jgi:integration host factor subunit beta
MKHLTKSELIETICSRMQVESPQLSKKDVVNAITTIFEAMTEALGREERIEIRGFGSFTVKHRQSRDGRNPKTGATVKVPPKRIPFFTVGKELRDRVNQAHADAKPAVEAKEA